MNDVKMPQAEKKYRCRTTQKWLDDGKVREKREIFRFHCEDPAGPKIVTRRERVVTFYTTLRGRDRLDNEIWYSTNDPVERERLRDELRAFLTSTVDLPSPAQ
jgi:hypothetical protein